MKSFIRGLYDVFFTYTDKHDSDIVGDDNRSNWHLMLAYFALVVFIVISAIVIILNTHADASVSTHIVRNIQATSHMLFLLSISLITICVVILCNMFDKCVCISVSIAFDIGYLMLLLISNIDIYVSSNKSEEYLNKICIMYMNDNKATIFYCWNVDAKSIEDRQLIKKYDELTATARDDN